MEINRVCIIGGSGFVGRHIAHQLVAQGRQVRIPTRQRERAKRLILLPTVDLIEANVHDAARLTRLVSGVDAVINLVGVLHGGRGNNSFEQAHVELTKKALAACHAQGIRRYVHMSALGADVNAASEYQRTKGRAEALVRESGLEWTIFRPSVIFGRDDNFLNLFARILELFPIVFLASPNARFQPVFVEDVARAFAISLGDPSAYGQSYDLCGPQVYTLRELVEFVGAVTDRRRPIIGLNDSLSALQASLLGLLPGKPMTRDNYLSMKVDNVSRQPFPFGIVPTAPEAVVASYLGGQSPRSRYRSYRDHAGRFNPR